ncbi:uncharacterized protein LOC106077643 isoform X2 [Biomphalaria glabrata]|uniref:Uncharacterized protein LOC106077643 isoform X2 n=1 Tax=Biomphalaria glabrata TaxID=6526 RepID=A0A9W2YUD6_BIOGL|nr:uncharacterized protein LOC106077643 isoform X2 [Biomphalaria glabrata]
MCLKFSDIFHDRRFCLWKCVYIYFVGMYLHLVNAQPELCDSNDATKTIVATLGTSINFSVCVVANISSPRFPLLKVNNVWLSRDHEGQNNQRFTWENTNVSTPDVFSLRIYIRNITVYQYGKLAIKLLISENSGLDLHWTIIPSEQNIIKLNFTDSEELLCEVNWYLKTIEIRNELTGQVINTLHNSNKMEIRKSITGHLPKIKECDNTGIYTCAVTDFQNVIHEKQLINRKPGCPVKFCDEKNRTTYTVTTNQTVNFSLCLFYNDDVDIEAVNIPKLSPEWREDMVNESYLLLHLNIDNISVRSAGDHNMEITAVNKRKTKVEKLNRNLTLILHKAIKLCNAGSNNRKVVASVGQNVSIEICIEDSYKNLRNVTINQRPVDWKNISVQNCRIFLLKQNSTDTYYLEVTIVNITEHTPLKYKVMLSTVLKDVLLYRFELILKDSLSLCEKEKNFTSVKTPMYGSVTIHICYITNFGQLEYCGVDNKPYRINDSEDNEDIYVSVEQFNNSTKYFMQINFRDITQDNTRKILWKTTPRQSLSYTVDILLLKEQNYELKNCEGQKFITYYYTNLLSNVSICVLIMSLANNQPCLQSTAYTQHGFANTSSEQISNVYISVNGSFVFIDVINVTDYNFGRYDWTLTMCENTNIDYTFYLIHDTLDLPSSLCNGGNTNFSVEASRDSLLSICFRIFSHLDRTLSINNYSVPIVSSVKEFQKYNYTMSDLELNFRNISVFNNWNQQLDTRYIQILLVPTKSQEMKIEFVSSNRILVYNISLNGLKTDGNEIWKNNGTNNTTREFTNRTDSQGDALKNDNMDSSVYIYAVLVVAVIVCTVVLIIVFIVRKKAKVKREKVETQLNLYTQGQRNDNNYINVDNQNDVMYMNLKTSRPRSLRLVANAPDLTKDLDERIYLNTCDLEQESSFIGIGDNDYKDPPSGRYISDEGLLYVTVSHANSLRSANSSASSRQTDNVIYASLDLEKSGKIPLLQFKQPRIKQKKKISDKKTNLNDFTITSSSPSQVNS